MSPATATPTTPPSLTSGPAAHPQLPSPSTVGVAPLSAAPTLTIEGKAWQVRRLGLTDLFRVCKIFQEIFTRGGAQVAMQFVRIDKNDRDQMTTLLLLGFTHVEDDLLNFAAGLVGATVEEIRDPAIFPVASSIAIMDALINHPDASLFFSQLGEAASRAMAVAEKIGADARTGGTTDSGGFSTTFSTDTDGRTT